MKKSLLLLIFLALVGCKDKDQPLNSDDELHEETPSMKEMEFKVLDSKILKKDSIWADFDAEMAGFLSQDYNRIKSLVYEKSIPQIQQAVADRDLTYEDLVLFYLNRIKKYDRENDLSLNSVIAINPNVIAEARKLDSIADEVDIYSIKGMPILLKDNINASEMPTTAGAVVFENNNADDSFIVQRLRENGALILGKANLSEWAYFFCGDCPSGYSAVGGQTLNPYGRKIHDTGGSSSGSGVSTAANFAVAAVGTETSGSILSPSSSNSIVGLKPTIGLLSRGGIVPISSTLDTPGPMTRNVIDNAILLNAMTGTDKEDSASEKLKAPAQDYTAGIKNITDVKAFLSKKRLGYFKESMEDTLYANAVNDLKEAGANLIEIEQQDIKLPQFTRVLNLDMQKDLPAYINKYGDKSLNVRDLDAVTSYNKEDSVIRMPYGQKLFYGVLADKASAKEFSAIKDTLQTNGRAFFDVPMKSNNLDAVLSINNYMAGYAAVAKYPAITVPMGYKDNNRPMGLTFIAPTLSEELLLQLAYAYESISHKRKVPANYE
ncbi:MAG: amidase family protein [Leeuwenhoekiella sp.]